MEVQGDTLFLAGYMFAESGAPIWYTSAGHFSSITYQGTWQQFDPGQHLGGTYRSPVLVNGGVGNLEIQFDSIDIGWMTLPNGRRIQIRRFVF